MAAKGLLIFPILKDLNKADGILVKNEGIRKGFAENGVETDVLEFTTQGIYNGSDKLFTFHEARIQRIYEYHTLIWKKIAHYINNKGYDFIWFRIPIITPYIASFVKNIKKKTPQRQIIIEYGAYPYVTELSGVKKKFYLLNKRSEAKAHYYADFVITYCGQDKVDNLVNIPINNGIDINDIPVNRGNNISKGIHFISVSSLKKWHAYERFITGIWLYIQSQGGIPIHFNIVGNGPEYEKLVTLVNELRLNSYVTFHNFKTGKELDAIYEQNHIAIGTLGFHRIGISNSSSLKNREYLARGLPIVLSTSDQDMPPNLPFVKYLKEGEEPINIGEVVAFAQKVYAMPKLNEQIRNYAEKHVTWATKIKTVLEYLNNKQVMKSQSLNRIYS